MKIFEIILFRFFLYSTIPIVGYIIETWVEVSKHQRAGFMLILLLPLLIPLLIIVPFWYLTIFRRVGFATKNRNKKNRGFVIPDEADAVFETDTTSEGTTTKRYYLWKIEHALYYYADWSDSIYHSIQHSRSVKSGGLDWLTEFSPKKLRDRTVDIKL